MFRTRSSKAKSKTKKTKTPRMVNVTVRLDDWKDFIARNDVGMYFLRADTEVAHLLIPAPVAKQLRILDY